MQKQTRDILRQLTAGKKPKEIAAAMKVPVQAVYNAKTRNKDVLKNRKVNTDSTGSPPLSKRVFDFIKKYPNLRACEYGDAFVTLGEKKNSVIGTVTHLINAGLVERNPKSMKLTPAAKEYRPLSQKLTHAYKETAYKPAKAAKPVVEKVDMVLEVGQPVYIPVSTKTLSLWGRIKAVFTGHYV